mgnify:CR=1 FL=1
MSQSALRLVENDKVDKSKALEAAVSQIERAFGKGSIMKLGERPAFDGDAVSTGSLGLDIALGIGGLPRGRIIEVYGPESSGKTTLALHVVAEAQKAGGTCAFVDAEHALDPGYALKLGVDVEVMGRSQMEKIGMGALLGVGQGSEREPKLVVMQWQGLPNGSGKGRKGKKDAASPIAFVGKGVTFDTGGISIKPSAGMEDMKWDMGGAGVVIGLMKALAGRAAKVNVVGIVGLVENMPSGSAQRPGDIVTSMSGQTIEVLNTDAEGRLVLADALWYCKDRFKPRWMVDLATLTGAMVVSLGQEKAGVFSNNDELAERIYAAGEAVDEHVWRMPLGDEYDKLIKSDVADMKNIGSRWGGSITAAQFLQRFVDKTPWVHIDIAGVTWSSKDKTTVPKGGTAFGVRLLDRLVADHYES